MTATRREFLQAGSALVVCFSLPLPAMGQASDDGLARDLDAWLAVSAGGNVTAYCGKVELGTGVRTAFTQLIAEELDIAPSRVTLVMGDTALCPDQGPTVGSMSLLAGGPQVRQAAAEARLALLAMASKRFAQPSALLSVKDGVVSAPDGAFASYGELLGGRRLQRTVNPRNRLKSPATFSQIGQPTPRVELPEKIFGSHEFVHNVRIPGMLHGRVLRDLRPDSVLTRVDDALLRNMRDVRVLRKGNFIGVVATREEDAIRAARDIKLTWSRVGRFPKMDQTESLLRTSPAADEVLVDTGDVDSALENAPRRLEANYYVPHQLHASIGPSCAIADVQADRATLWSPTQSSFLTRKSVADLLGLQPDRVRLIWSEGSGCYGHNGADDCTADAALLSQLAGKPVRVQWMRHDEHGNEPNGAAMAMRIQGALDASGKVVAWHGEVWSPSHNGRPAHGGANLLAGTQLGRSAAPFAFGAERNAQCSYTFAHARTTLHQLKVSPSLRVSALRGLGSPQNTFANESFIDELAALAKADPIEFRVRHLEDPRAIAVLQAVARLARWDVRPSPRSPAASAGRGVAFVHYDNFSTYVAVVVQVEVDRATGKLRIPFVAVAHDCGLIVNPDGVKNQIEGNVIQAMSRALLEEVTFDDAGVTSLDWGAYPILRFSAVPREIAIELVNRPDTPMLGAGEATTAPIGAAIANALCDATGVRLRAMPFTPQRVLNALDSV